MATTADTDTETAAVDQAAPLDAFLVDTAPGSALSAAPLDEG
jgi:hypothetical protein